MHSKMKQDIDDIMFCLPAMDPRKCANQFRDVLDRNLGNWEIVLKNIKNHVSLVSISSFFRLQRTHYCSEPSLSRSLTPSPSHSLLVNLQHTHTFPPSHSHINTHPPLHTHTHTHSLSLSLGERAHTHARTHARTHAHTHARTHTHTHTHTHPASHRHIHSDIHFEKKSLLASKYMYTLTWKI